MKQKEKWATAYCEGPDSEIMDTIMAHKQTWLAGFQFAKCRILEIGFIDQNRFGHIIPGIEIDSLGEEEIKGE